MSSNKGVVSSWFRPCTQLVFWNEIDTMLCIIHFGKQEVLTSTCVDSLMTQESGGFCV